MSADARRPSLAQRFATASACLAAAALLAMAAVAWLWAERLHQAAAREIAQRDLAWHASRVADALQHVDSRLREIAATPLIQTALTDTAARVSYLQPYVESIRAIDAMPVRLTVVDFAGQPIAGQRVDVEPPVMRWLKDGLGEQRTRALLAGSGADRQLWFAVGVVYQRSNTVEGQVWASLRLADLPQDTVHRLLSPDATKAAGALTIPVALPPPFDTLGLTMARDGETLAVPRDAGLVLGFLSVAALLVLVAGVAARWVARSLTRDLAVLERFAGQAVLAGDGGHRAPDSGPREVSGLAGSINRMLDRLREQHQVLDSKRQGELALLSACIANLGDAVLITGVAEEGGRVRYPIVFANPAFERMTGYTVVEVLGRSPEFLQGPDTDPAEVRRLGRALRALEPVRVEMLNHAKDGRRYWVEMHVVSVPDAQGRPCHFVAIERDTTARRALDEQQRQSQKMEAIGTLAGGVAHDFNNVLAAILGNVALSQHDLRQGRPIDEWLAQIGKSAERARALVQQILTYSRRSPQSRQPQDLGSLVAETVSMLRATVPAGVRIAMQLPAEPVAVVADATSIEQVLLNLGTNAWQSMDGAAGEVVFGLRTEQGAAPDERWAHLWVQDDGCGMDEATRQRIFEPYFTTKPVGRGTGLGLAVVEGIVREHGGRLSVDSQRGRGSTFHVHLPLGQAAVVAQDAGPAPAPMAHGPLRGNVLYVDDDDVLCLVVSAQLQRWGCSVRHLRSADDALALLGDPAIAVDVLVSDINMPGLSGVELARALCTLRPALPVLLTSGHLADEVRSAARLPNVRALLRKECLQDELQAALRRVLQDVAAAPGSQAAVLAD